LEWKGPSFQKFTEIEFGVASKRPFCLYSCLWNYKSNHQLFRGQIGESIWQKNLLLFGWFLHYNPFILIYATSWNWVIFAIFLLGISRTIEQYGGDENRFGWRKDRGLAMDSTNLQVISPLAWLLPCQGYIAENTGSPLPFLSGIDFDNWILLTLFLSKTRD
jgi:hypothetical protein